MRATRYGWLIATLAITPAVHASNGSNNDGVDLDLTIIGRISPKCEINLPEKAVHVQLFDRPGNEQVEFTVNCNQKLSVTMTSLNGGLEHVTHSRGEQFEGFQNFLPYTAQFDVNADGAQVVSIDSEAMVGGATGSIGVVPFSTNGTLNLSWDPEQPLVGGTYEDVIEIRVTGAG
jgi:hypothetical protein